MNSSTLYHHITIRNLPHLMLSINRWCGVRTYSSTHRLIKFTTRQALWDSCNENITLSKLRNAYLTGKFQIVPSVEGSECTPELNSNRSLPIVKFPKDQIFLEVTNDPKIGNWRKPVVKLFRLGKAIFKLYNQGLKNTWHVYKDTKQLAKQYQESDLVTPFFKAIEFKEIESRLLKDNSEISLPVNRKQFQELQRRSEFWKIPGFVVLLIALEEFITVFCYIFPSITPWNCLIPSVFKKISDSQAVHRNSEKSVSSIRGDENRGVPKYRSPYTLLYDELHRFVLTRNLIPRWKMFIYKLANNRTIPSESITRLHQYLFVDDWLLSRHVLSRDTVTKLSDRELVNTVLERQLYYRGEDLNSMVQNDLGKNVLVWRLIIYWSFRLDGTISANVGEEELKDFPLFSEKWGVNNVGILNFAGSEALVTDKDIEVLQEGGNK